MVECSVFTLGFKFLTCGKVDEENERLIYAWDFGENLPLHGLVMVGNSADFDPTKLFGTFSGSACWNGEAGITITSIFTPIPAQKIHA